MVQYLEPIREKRKALLQDKNRIHAILEQGRKKAQESAAKTISEVKGLIGFLLS